MYNLDEIRRANLKILQEEAGGESKFIEKANMTKVQFQNLRDGAKDSKTGKPRGMRPNTARRFEAAGRKPTGWLDQDHSCGDNPVTVECHLTDEQKEFIEALRYLTQDDKAEFLRRAQQIKIICMELHGKVPDKPDKPYLPLPGSEKKPAAGGGTP